MPPTVTSVLHQGSPAMTASPGLSAAPYHPPEQRPLGTTYYVQYEEPEAMNQGGNSVPYTSYTQNAYLVSQLPSSSAPYMGGFPGSAGPSSAVMTGYAASSSGSSPSPHAPEVLHTPSMAPMHTSATMAPTQYSPGLPSMAQSQDQGAHYQQPTVSPQYSPGGPGTTGQGLAHWPLPLPHMAFMPFQATQVPPNQLLHVQIPQGISVYGQPVSQPAYQPQNSDHRRPLPLPVPASQHTSVTTNLEVVWHSEFERLFRTLNPNHKWVLVPKMEPSEDVKGHSFKDSAKVRFCCKCGNGWTSMKGRVMFWYHFEESSQMGFVYFRLYGQRCIKCDNPDFVHAMWYPEEVLKVINNIFMRVGQQYYNFYQPPLLLSRRDGKPRNQHNAKLCQACAEGVCREAFIST